MCKVHPSTSQHRPVQPITAKSNPVESRTVQYRPVQPSTVYYSPVQSSTVPYSPIQPEHPSCRLTHHSMLTMHIFNSTSTLFPCINNEFVHIGFHTFKKPYKPILIHEFFQLMTRSHHIKELICLQQEICWGKLIVCKNNLHETGNGVRTVFLNKGKQF